MGTKLERKDIKVFASQPNHATQVSAFLTGKNETPDYTLDPNAIQNTYYPKGWFGDGENDLPQGTDMNGVMYTESYKNAYLYEMGIAEWSSTQEYFENSYCQVNGVLYLSLIDENLNNNPTTDDGTKWKEIALEPYVGENIGSAEGIYAGKTLNNELQFKGIAVTGNGNISSSNDTITIEIGGGETGSVYWGAIDGTLSNQSDLQQALNLKQNLIGYTPENSANKVTTVRTDTVATDTAYPSELATRTAIDNAITSANNYTNNALTNLSTNAFVLYANSWTDIDTGTLTTTPPTGTGLPHLIRLSQPNTYEDIANFTYTTTQETKFNSTFTYNVLMPIRNVRPKKWRFKFKLSIQHQDVNNGLEFKIFETDDMDVIVDLLDNLNFQFRQDLINISEITYPVGSTIKLNIKALSNPEVGETSNYDFELLVYDKRYPLVISRNKGINKFYSTSLITQTLGDEVNQEYFNSYMLKQLTPMTATSPLTISSNNISIGSASTSTSGALSSTDWNTFNGKQDTISATAPLSLSSNTISIGKADGSTNGYLSSTDWTTFSNKYNSTNTGLNMFHTTDTTTIRPVVEAGYTNSYIGTSSYPFTKGYINDVYVSTINGTSNNITVSSNLNPDSTDNNRKLGSSSNKFYEGWISYVKTLQLVAMAGGTKLNLGYNYMSPETADQYQLGYQSRFLYVYSLHFDQGSDIRNKSNIKDYDESVLEKIKNITPITYNYKNEDRTTLGISAQELKEIEPLIVHTQIKETKDGKDEDLGVDLYSLSVFAIKAIKELNAKVEALEARVNELEGNKKELEK